MATTKEINLFLNFKKDTPSHIIESLRKFKINSEEPACKVLCNDYRHAGGQPVIDFYAAGERLGQYQRDDGTYYLRYCNIIKDYDNEFETWLESVAPWVIQANGYHIGTLFNDYNDSLLLICIKNKKPVYRLLPKA